MEETGEDRVGHLVVEAALGEVFQQRRPVVARNLVRGRHKLFNGGVLISPMSELILLLRSRTHKLEGDSSEGPKSNVSHPGIGDADDAFAFARQRARENEQGENR